MATLRHFQIEITTNFDTRSTILPSQNGEFFEIIQSLNSCLDFWRIIDNHQSLLKKR